MKGPNFAWYGWIGNFQMWPNWFLRGYVGEWHFSEHGCFIYCDCVISIILISTIKFMLIFSDYNVNPSFFTVYWINIWEVGLGMDGWCQCFSQPCGIDGTVEQRRALLINQVIIMPAWVLRCSLLWGSCVVQAVVQWSSASIANVILNASY